MSHRNAAPARPAEVQVWCPNREGPLAHAPGGRHLIPSSCARCRRVSGWLCRHRGAPGILRLCRLLTPGDLGLSMPLRRPFHPWGLAMLHCRGMCACLPGPWLPRGRLACCRPPELRFSSRRCDVRHDPPDISRPCGHSRPFSSHF